MTQITEHEEAHHSYLPLLALCQARLATKLRGSSKDRIFGTSMGKDQRATDAGVQTLTSAHSLDSSSLKEPRVALRRLSFQRVALPCCRQAQVSAARPAAEGVCLWPRLPLRSRMRNAYIK